MASHAIEHEQPYPSLFGHRAALIWSGILVSVLGYQLLQSLVPLLVYVPPGTTPENYYLLPVIAHLLDTPQTRDNIDSEQGAIFGIVMAALIAISIYGLKEVRRFIGAARFGAGASYFVTVALGMVGFWLLGTGNANLGFIGGGILVAASLMLIKLVFRVKRILPMATGVAAIGGLVLCLLAVAFANARIAEIAGATALVCGVWYWDLTTDFDALWQQVRSELVGRWRRGAGRQVMGGTALIVAAIVLYTFAATGRAARPQTINEAQFFLLGWIALMVGIFSIGILGRGLLNLIKGLVPKPGPGIAAVERQKVHGNAGYAGRPQVDAALRDQDQAGYSAPHFRD